MTDRSYLNAMPREQREAEMRKYFGEYMGLQTAEAVQVRKARRSRDGRDSPLGPLDQGLQGRHGASFGH